ncbi:MAG: 3-hydroxyacyl-CoA dehydrogenase NAD-binding domain-containing protein [Pseudomonadota bacterium]
MSRPVHVKTEGDLAWVTIDNPPINATSTAVRAGLLSAVEQVQGCKLAILVCAGRTFVAGGDMREFDAPAAEPHLPDVVNAIENSGTPFLAILHGTVLGGGLEIAIACAYRLARPGTRMGLPEVNIGLVPGAGGTQRAPRLFGWQIAVEMACLGQVKTAESLLALGGIDGIADTPENRVRGFIDRPFQKVSDRTMPAPLMRASFEDEIAKFANGREGPWHNLDALSWATEPFSVAQPRERQLHLQLRGSAESQALRHIFFAERSTAKPAVVDGVRPANFQHVAIVGGGLMGSGIAATCLNAGLSVTTVEQNSDAAVTARQSIVRLLEGGLSRGKMTRDQFESRCASLVTTDNFADAASVDLAIEAVFEDLDLKRSVFAALAQVVRPDAVLATNTSYLDPNEIFAGVPNLGRCLGLHFFSPAHIMKLLEVIRTDETNQETLASAFALAKALRKTPVLAGVCDGFIGNRILTAYRRAAEYLLADGALPHDIDSAMRAFGMALGPFETQDQSGLQIAMANRRRQDETRDPNERYIPILDRLCAMDRLGKRSGAGWYSYAKGKTPQRDHYVEQLIKDYSAEVGITRRSFREEDIQMQLLTAMANEGARIVEEGIAESDSAVDVVKIAGYGFPRWRGGPMHWAEAQGAKTIQQTLAKMNGASPSSWSVALRYQGDTNEVTE